MSSLQPPLSSYIFTAQESRDIDQKTIEKIGIDSFTLMEVAGSSAAGFLAKKLPEKSHGLYFCGKGNNAGDALVVARYLLQHDMHATIVFLSGTDNLSKDAEKNLELLKIFDEPNNVHLIESWDEFKRPEEFDFMIDGMLGTGLSSELRPNYLEAVEWINSQPQPVFAMDIPTGLHADTGKIMGEAIQAGQTFAFGGRKQGFYFKDGPSHAGEIHYCELPFPVKFKAGCNTFLLDEKWASPPEPRLGQHKYDSGVLYLIAGSEGLTGAAITAAKSAWGEGLGAVILLCPRGILSVYENNLPSIIKKPLGKRDDFNFKSTHAEKALKIIKQKEGKVLLGPGLGRQQETLKFVKQCLAGITADMVIDADGLWALAQLEDWSKPAESRWTLTPHPGELKRLIEAEDLSWVEQSRLELVRNYAAKKNITVLSKGMPGVISVSEGQCYITHYNTRYFARAGTGDVLAGKVGAFSALGNAPAESCAYALMRGKQKLDHYLSSHNNLPEPKDFL